MSSMTSAQLISVAAKGLTLANPSCIPSYTVSTTRHNFWWNIFTWCCSCCFWLTARHNINHAYSFIIAMTNNLEIHKKPSRLTLHHMLRESLVPVSQLTFDSSSSSHKTRLVNHRRKDFTFETMTNKIARLLIWCATTPKIQLASITCFWPFPDTLDCNYAIESEMNCTPVNHCNINLNFLSTAERFVIHLNL